MKNGRNVKTGLAAVLALGVAGSVWAQSMAPVNPAFARWQREKAAKAADGASAEPAKPRAARSPQTRGGAGAEEQDFGFVPTVLDMGYLQNLNDNLTQGVGAALPASYDLRGQGALTPVRDQGSYGNCWAFAALGSLESWVLKSEGAALDLSENHLANLHGWNQGFGAGGNAQMAQGYLLRWAGPVEEGADAYPRPGKSAAGTPPVRHVQRVRWIPGRTAYLDNDGIKSALMAYGALQTEYYHASGFYDAESAAYYYNPGTSFRRANHAVDVVGWDDGYPRKNFTPRPPADGAFLVRNSWGSGWGDGGYFHVSYYDESFAWGPLYSYSGAEPADNYDGIYQHDPLGMVGSTGFGGPVAWGANMFTATNASKVAAVGFYAMVPRTTYTLYVYTGCRAGEPRSGTLAAQQSGTVDTAGYATVPLESPAPVAAGKRFSVVVQLSTPGYAYPLATEYAVAGYSAQAAAAEGESFLSANGTSWSDFTKRLNSTANFCCKAYVKGGAAAKVLSGIAISGVNSLKAGSTERFACTAEYTDGSSKAVAPKWTVAAGKSWASVTAAGDVTAKAVTEQKTVTLRATHTEGGVTKTADWQLYVTVAPPAAPIGLTATAGTEESCVRLAWEPSAGAAGYAVYRGTKESSAHAAYLGTVTVPRYADTAAVPGVDYRYFLKAKNGSGSSPFSSGAWGWRAIAAPTGLSASDGSHEDGVEVAWNRSEGASCYRVWRADSPDADPEPLSAWQTACRILDTSAEAGMTYTYTVTAALDAEGTRESAQAIPDEGFRTGPRALKGLEISGPVSLASGARGTYSCAALYTDGTRTQVKPGWSLEGGSLALSGANAVVTAPTASENTILSLSAAYTDGTTRRATLSIMVTPAVPAAPASLELVTVGEDGITLRWSAVDGASSYQLWRAAEDEDFHVIAATTSTRHTDASAVPGVAYTYRVAAANGAGAGAPGAASVTAVRPIPAPVGVSASYGTYADKVLVTWRASEGAAFYRVWRAESADGEKTALGDWQAALSFDDTTGEAGTVYYYSVQAAADAAGTAAGAFGGPAVGLRKVAPKPLSLTVLGPDRVAAESTAAYSAKVRYDNGAVQTVTPVWYLASGAAFASIGADGRLEVGALSEDRTVTVAARFTDGGTTVEGSLEVVLVAPIVQTATVKDVEAHARWPWNGWVDVDYTLETAPTGTVAKVSLSGYDRDHKAALVATTLAGDGARGATVAAGRHRISWNLGVDYPDFHAKQVRVSLEAIPAEPIDPNLVNGGLAAAFFDLNSSILPYSTWNASYNDMREFFATRSPAIVTNTVYVGDTFDFGTSADGTSMFPGKFSQQSTDYFATLLWGTIEIPQTGTYQFRAVSDDGIALYIDQKLVFGATTVRSMTDGQYGADSNLIAGTHEIAIAFHEYTGAQALQMYWQSPTASEQDFLPQSILYYTDPSTECFTVRFSANGGTGAMSDWMCNPNFAAMLPANTFKRSGFTFAGWATSASGAVQFTDGQDVTGWDVAAGETLTLYAVWKEIEAGELPTKGLVAYYPFNGNLNDESGNGYHLTNEGGILAADRFGNAKRALSFDGQKHRAYPESFRRTNSFSVACWFKTDVTKASYGSGSTAWNEGNYVFFPNHGGNNAGVGFKVGTDGIEVVEHGSCYMPSKLQYNAQIGSGWNHVCMVVQNNTGVRIYLNGKSVDSATLSSLEKYCGIHIGGDAWGYYTGLVDELCVYDRVLSDDEVEQVYRAGLADGGDDEPHTPVWKDECGVWQSELSDGKNWNMGVSLDGDSLHLTSGGRVFLSVSGPGTLQFRARGSYDGFWYTARDSYGDFYYKDGSYIRNEDSFQDYSLEIPDAGLHTVLWMTYAQGYIVDNAWGEIKDVFWNGVAVPLEGAVASSLENGLVAYWPFDGDARDASGNGNDGVVNGATLTSDRNGTANGAYHFDGNNTITVADNELLRSVTNAFTIATWLKYESFSDWYGTGGHWITVLSKGTEGRQYGLSIYKISTGTEIGLTQHATFEQLPEQGVWTHVAVTFDTNRMARAYVDGVLVGTQQNEETLTVNQEALVIGADPHGDTEYLYGSLDDLGIWNRALTEEEVARLYAGEKPVGE